MNKRKILANINKIANELDQNLFHKEANQLTKVMIKIAGDFPEDDYDELMKRSREETEEREKILDIYKRIFKQMQEDQLSPKKDPVEEAAEKGMSDFPGSEYDRAYDTALQDIQAAFEMHDNPPDYEDMAAKAKDVAEEYMKIENRTLQDLVSLCDDAIYDLEL